MDSVLLLGIFVNDIYSFKVCTIDIYKVVNYHF